MSKTTTHEVVVHKAGLTLMKGESLGQFTRSLSVAARKALGQKLNLDFAATNKNGSPTAGAYMLEVFSDSLVFDVWKAQSENEPSNYRYFAMKYSRKATGEFEFSYTTEVERVTTYQAKESAPVTKAKPDPKKAFAPAPAERQVAKALPQVTPGWQQTSKSFWSGTTHVL